MNAPAMVVSSPTHLPAYHEATTVPSSSPIRIPALPVTCCTREPAARLTRQAPVPNTAPFKVSLRAAVICMRLSPFLKMIFYYPLCEAGTRERLGDAPDHA